jgi:hypothetical protein
MDNPHSKNLIKNPPKKSKTQKIAPTNELSTQLIKNKNFATINALDNENFIFIIFF